MQPFASRSTIAATCGALLLLLGCASDPAQPRETDDDSDDSEDDESSPSTRSDASSAGPSGPSGSNRDGGTSSGSRRDSGGSSSGGTTNRDGGASSSGGGGGNGQCKLTPNEDGWVAETTNDAKVQGAFYTYASDGSTIDPLTTATNPFKNDGSGKLCVKGSAAMVVDMMYSKYFGAGMAFDVCAPAGAAADTKYTVAECPGGLDLVGIKFTLSGKTIPSELRVTFHEAMRDESTYVLAKSGANEALIANAKVAYMPTAPAANAGKVDAIHFAIPTNEMSATPFEFCVEDIRVLTKSGPCTDGEATPAPGGGNDSGSSGGTRDAGGGTSGSDAGTGSNNGSDAGGGSAVDDAGENVPSPLCSRSGAMTSTMQYGRISLGKYAARNNIWGLSQNLQGIGTQTLWANGPRCWGVDAMHRDVEQRGTEGAARKGWVKSYPNVYRGWSIQDNLSSANHGLGKRVSEITKARIRWKMQAPSTGRSMALWDIYFHETANPPSGPSTADKAAVNLMIQQYIVDQDKYLTVQESGNAQQWEIVTIGDSSYRYRRENDSRDPSWSRSQCKLYVNAPSGETMLGKKDMTIDLKAVMNFCVMKGKLRETDYLTGIQAGYEIIEGGTYQTDDLWTSINDEPEGN